MTANRIVWQYWENSPKYPDGIPYIDLCHQSVELHCDDGKGYKLIRLNSSTLHRYLKEDELNPYLANVQGDSCQLAQKADYIRVKLLKKYGGIWLDSDTVVVDKLDEIFNTLEIVDFYGYFIKNPCVWAFACKAEAKIMKEWDELNEQVLNNTKGKGLGLGELGHKNLRLLMDKYRFDFKVYFCPANKVHPIDHRNCYLYLQPGDIQSYLKEKQPFFVLNNALLPQDLKKKDKYQIAKENTLLSSLFKLSGVTKNIVLVTSVILTPATPLSYGKRSVFTHEERYNQTIKTIETVKSKVPNVDILFVECSDFSNHTEWEQTLKSKVKYYVNVYNDEEKRKLVLGPYKQLGEGTLTRAGLTYIEKNKIPYNNYIKISGRYFLSDTFDYKIFENTTNVFRKLRFGNVITTLYKMNRETASAFKNFLETSLLQLASKGDQWGYESIVAEFCKNVDCTYIDRYLGVSGIVSCTGQLASQ